MRESKINLTLQRKRNVHDPKWSDFDNLYKFVIIKTVQYLAFRKTNKSMEQ